MNKQEVLSLKDKHQGETCYIFGCGPSLKDFFSAADQVTIENLYKNHTIVTIKQSYLQLRNKSHYHFFNCNNFVSYKKNNNMFIAQDDGVPEQHLKNFWGDQEYDFVFNLNPATNFLARTKNIDSFLIESDFTRPRGPGIMFETVLFFVYHLGFKEIKTVGWDYCDPNSIEMPEHFYPESARLKTINPCSPPYPKEMLESVELAGVFCDWFSEKNINLSAFDSKKCFLPDIIKRFSL